MSPLGRAAPPRDTFEVPTATPTGTPGQSPPMSPVQTAGQSRSSSKSKPVRRRSLAGKLLEQAPPSPRLRGVQFAEVRRPAVLLLLSLLLLPLLLCCCCRGGPGCFWQLLGRFSGSF
jgi:hypothetical protein